MYRSLRSWLRWLSMFCIVVSVLVSCNTGDSPVAIRPPSQESVLISEPTPTVDGPIASSLTALQARVLYSGFGEPLGLVKDGDALVVADHGGPWGLWSGLVRVPLDGSPAQTLARGQIGRPLDLDIDGDNYVVTDSEGGGRLWLVPKSGASPTLLLSGLGYPTDIQAHGSAYFILDPQHPRLLSVEDQSDLFSLGLSAAGGLESPFGFTFLSIGQQLDPMYPVLTDAGKQQIYAHATSLVEPTAPYIPLGLPGLHKPMGIEALDPQRFLVADEGLSENTGRLLEVSRTLPGLVGQIQQVLYEGGNPRYVTVAGFEQYAFTDPQARKLVLLESGSGSPTEEGVRITPGWDGRALTVGEEITLTATAADEQGYDISDRINWRDGDERFLGRGATLTLTPTEVGMLTVSANLAFGGSDRVSMTVSAPGYVLADHVKALPEDAPELVVSRDPSAGVLVLQQDERLPTLQAGDVVVGAGLLVPPVRVLQVSEEQGNWVLQVEAASPTDVIVTGDFPEEVWEAALWDPTQQRVLRSGSGTGAGVSLVEMGACLLDELSFPRISFESPAIKLADPVSETLTLNLPEKWDEVFLNIEEPTITAGLGQIDGYISGSFCPRLVKPEIKIEDRQLKKFEVSVGQEAMELEAYISVGGMGRVETSVSVERLSIPIPLPESIPIRVVKVGVVPVFITVGFTDLWTTMRMNPSAEVRLNIDKLGLRYEGIEYEARAGYDESRGEGDEWYASLDTPPSFPTAQPLVEDLRGGAQGNIEIQFQPELGVGIWADLLPIEGVIDFIDDPFDVGAVIDVGLELTLGADLELSATDQVVIESPGSGSSYGGEEEIRLQAGLGQLSPATAQLYAGVDLTIGGGTEDECPLGLEEEGQDLVSFSSKRGISLTEEESSCCNDETKTLEDLKNRERDTRSTIHDKHIEGTGPANKELQKSGSVHVFKDEVTRDAVVADIMTRGEYVGFADGHDRFVVRYNEPIGYQIFNDGRESMPLYIAEIKVSRKRCQWHADPRVKPRTPES